MAPPGRAGFNLTDEQILECLDQSDYEDDATDDEYIPSVNGDEPTDTDEDTSGDTEEEGELSLSHSVFTSRRTRVSRRGRSLSRVCGRRGRSRLPRASSSMTRYIETDHEAEWQFKHFTPFEPQLSEPNYPPLNTENFKRIDYFEQYLDDSFITLITEKSNQTFVSNTGKSLNLTPTECKKFIAITMAMSCLNFPYLRMYWERRWRVPFIANSMPRNRFFQLRSSLKIVFDNDISHDQRARDKLWKVRPIIERVLQGCHKQIKQQHISIDEMIVPFSGTCGIKQYCPKKPNPTGLKAFVLANPDGMVCDFTVYQGSTTYPEENASGFGLGESAVINLTRSLVPGHIIYFDRYFTSVKLAEELNARGFKCAGTLNKKRIPATLRSVLPDDAEMKSLVRGESSVFVNSNETIACTKWFDNKPVLLLSTIYGNEPQDQCRRWCKTRREYISIKRPIVVKMYNSSMGGVDMADRMLAVCPSRARTKKWTIRFISHMIDLSASNSWIQFRKSELIKGTPLKKIESLRQWKLALAESMIENSELEEMSDVQQEQIEHIRKRGRPSVNPIPSKASRVHGASHMPIFTGVMNRCRKEGCNKRSSAKCSTCDVILCLSSARNCYKEFHEQ